MSEKTLPSSTENLPRSVALLIAINLLMVYLPTLWMVNEIGWTPFLPVILWCERFEPVSWVVLTIFLLTIVVMSIAFGRSNVAWVVIPVVLLLWSLFVSFLVSASNAV